MDQLPTPGSTIETDGVRPFGKYFLLRKLAEGGMAEIFLAKHVGSEGFERNVVIKRMLPSLSSDPEFVDMFLHEAKLAARLTHQNIIQIHDLDVVDGHYYICMEYLPGEDFSTILRRASRDGRYIPFPIVLRVIADAAHGLHSAHESTDEHGKPLNIVHRDISPSNIYVTYQGQVKVLDFGIAKAESRLTRTTAGVVKGKYTYMSPEQARGAPLDRRADVFSLGVTLFEALTYVRPFWRESDLGILNAVVQGDFQQPQAYRADIPADIQRAILKAMASKVEDRYQTAAAFAASLEQLSASSSKEVGSYVRELFGEEAVTQKTRIPPVSQLLPPGARPKTPTPSSAPTERNRASVEEKTLAAPTPQLGQSRGHRAFYVAGLLVAVLVALGGVGILRKRAEHPVPAGATPPVAFLPPPTVPTVATPATPPLASEPTAPETPEQPNEEVTAPVQNPELLVSKPPPPRKRVNLDEGAVQKIVERHRASISHCFEAFQSELPTQDGSVTVTFTILSSGKVVEAQVGDPLNGTRAGKCLRERVSRLPFPANTAKATRLGVPFSFHVQH